jgi:multimeric flavodoxin WrbA
MHILTFAASPRRGGNSDLLREAVAAGIEDAGGTVSVVRPYDINIAPCGECCECARTGFCAVDDDFMEVARQIVEADGIVFATPLFFMNTPAPAKAIIDRSQSFWAARHILKRDLFGGRRHRAGLLAACGGANAGKANVDLFRGVEDTMTFVFDAWGVRMLERLTVPGVDGFGAIGDKPGVLEAARIRGRELAAACVTP